MSAMVLVVVLSGCQPVTVQRAAGSIPVAVRVDDAAYWLEEWQRAVALPEDQLQLTLKNREAEFSELPDARSGLRLALLLVAGPAPVRDHARASNLLKKLNIHGSSDSARALAALLEQVIAEQQWSGDKITELRTRLKETEARVEELERQLQELTDIEQRIQQRN